MNYTNFTGYKNVEAMKNAGWTEAEILELKNAPRTREAEGDSEGTFFKWPYINGVSTCGLYTVLNEQERALYRAYYKRSHSGSSSSSSSNSVDLSKFATLKEALIKMKASKEVMTLLEEITPKPKVAIEIKAGDTLVELLTKNAAIKDVYAKILKSAETLGLDLKDGTFVEK